jgi:sulfatase modifying factor 1
MLGATLLVAVLQLAASSPAATPGRSSVTIPAGTYHPAYVIAGGGGIRIDRFSLDRDPVTRGQYLAFVSGHPHWRRSRIDPRRADGAYLAGWRSDLNAGTPSDLHRPVTGVSWYAAKAFCEAQRKRLPTLAEWEYAAAASFARRDASRDPAFIQSLVSVYATRGLVTVVDSAETNAFGVRGMHGLVWEWTADANSGIASRQHLHHVHAGRSGEHDMSCAGAALGAADPGNYPAFLRAAVRAGLTETSTLWSLGFRCAG